MAGVDWAKVGESLRDMGGWENTGARPNPDHGAAPIADRPGDWTWRPAVPKWLRDPPEPAPAVPEPPAAVDSYGAVPQPSGPARWMFGTDGEE